MCTDIALIIIVLEGGRQLPLSPSRTQHFPYYSVVYEPDHCSMLTCMYQSMVSVVDVVSKLIWHSNKYSLTAVVVG